MDASYEFLTLPGMNFRPKVGEKCALFHSIRPLNEEQAAEAMMLARIANTVAANAFPNLLRTENFPCHSWWRRSGNLASCGYARSCHPCKGAKVLLFLIL